MRLGRDGSGEHTPTPSTAPEAAFRARLPSPPAMAAPPSLCGAPAPCPAGATDSGRGRAASGGAGAAASGRLPSPNR